MTLTQGGTAHKIPKDFKEAVLSDKEVSKLWESLTPLGRNEFICWIENAKKTETRQRRIKRACEELLEGKRRPCCWIGCIHRTDKKPSRWAQVVLVNKKPSQNA